MSPEPDWRLAECYQKGVPTEWFFFEDELRVSTKEYELAKVRAAAICGACPIQGECAEYAITTNQEGGMWGGLTTSQRRQERRRRYQQAQRELQDWLRSSHP